MLLFQLKNNFLKNAESNELENHKEGFPFSFKIACPNYCDKTFPNFQGASKPKRGGGRSVLNKT